MSDRSVSVVCRTCGTGFVVTETYRDLLNRRGAQVVHPPQCPTCFVGRGPLPKVHGFVKWYNPHKHYGFLVADDGTEAFVHERQIVAALQSGLQAGSEVRFHLHHPPKGPEALNVELVQD